MYPSEDHHKLMRMCKKLESETLCGDLSIVANISTNPDLIFTIVQPDHMWKYSGYDEAAVDGPPGENGFVMNVCYVTRT